MEKEAREEEEEEEEEEGGHGRLPQTQTSSSPVEHSQRPKAGHKGADRSCDCRQGVGRQNQNRHSACTYPSRLVTTYCCVFGGRSDSCYIAICVVCLTVGCGQRERPQITERSRHQSPEFEAQGIEPSQRSVSSCELATQQQLCDVQMNDQRTASEKALSRSQARLAHLEALERSAQPSTPAMPAAPAPASSSSSTSASASSASAPPSPSKRMKFDRDAKQPASAEQPPPTATAPPAGAGVTNSSEYTATEQRLYRIFADHLLRSGTPLSRMSVLSYAPLFPLPHFHVTCDDRAV
jgi:hypothetical protein